MRRAAEGRINAGSVLILHDQPQRRRARTVRRQLLEVVRCKVSGWEGRSAASGLPGGDPDGGFVPRDATAVDW